MIGDRLSGVRQRLARLDESLTQGGVTPAASGELRAAGDELTAIAVELQRQEMQLLAVREAMATERRRTDNPSEDRFENAFAHAPIGMALVGLDGRMFHVNSALCEMFGYSEADVLAGAIVEIATPEEVDEALACARRLIKGEVQRYQIERRFRHRDGHIVETLVSVSMVRNAERERRYFICQLLDITDRKRAEEALRASEERFRAVVENAFDVISFLDAEGRLLYSTPNTQRVFGTDPKEFGGRVVVEEGVHREEAETARQQFRQALEQPGTVVTGQQRLRRSDGSWVWIEGRACNMLANPHVRAIVVNSRDITERKRAEEEARQRQAELAHVLRVNSMGEIASSLAHEINQPLAAIVNYARGCKLRLQAQPSTVRPVLDALEHIAEEALRAGGIIRGLRQFLRKEPTPPAWEDLNRLVSDASGLVEAEARQQAIAIRLRLNPTIPRVRVDGVQIEQVIVNLLRNGLEAIDRARGAVRELVIRTTRADSGSLVVEVCDSGEGVPVDIVEKVFDPFFTTKQNGLGMGLSISRSIIQAHGGRIWATPNSEGGMTFSFTIPIGNGGEEEQRSEQRRA